MSTATREIKSAAPAMPAAGRRATDPLVATGDTTTADAPDTKGTAAKSVVPFAVKASDDGARTITGLAAAWTQDSYDDVIEPGAFARTLGRWRAAQKSRPIPLIDQHDYSTSRAVIGKMTDAEETAEGLLATFEFIADDPDADAVYRRVKGGFITGLSIGYRAIRWEYEQKPGGDEWERIRHIKEVQLLEVSVVTYPANDDARIEAVKSFALLTAALKSGNLTSAQRAELRALLDGSDASLPIIAPAAETQQPADAAPLVDEPKGLAPEAPERLAMEATLRSLILRTLAPAA